VRFTRDVERHCEGVLAIPYNAFSEIRADKWLDQANRERIKRVLPRLADLATEMGYTVPA